MKNAPKPDNDNLAKFLRRLREGKFVIPDFQRDFEWEPKDILELMRSIFLDYYIGSLLLWSTDETTFSALACEPLQVFPHDVETKPEHIVLDGQQRLSAMYYAFMAPDTPAPNRKARYLYFIRVDKWANDEPDEAFVHYWTSEGTNLLANPQEQFRGRLFPLRTFGDPESFAIADWINGYKAFWTERRNAAKSALEEEEATRSLAQGKEFGDHLIELREQYKIAYIVLDRDLDLDKICDTFTRINTRGVRLDIFDLMNALLRPKDVHLKEMWREAKPHLEFLNSANANVYVLQVMSLLLQQYCSPKYIYYLLPGAERKIRANDGSLRDEVLVSDGSVFKQRWSESVEVIQTAVSRLSDPREFGAISPRFLPYMSIVPAFSAALQAAGRASHSDRLKANFKVRDWYWASVFTNRYSGSVESTAARDVLEVTKWIDDDNARPHVITEFSTRLDDLDLRDEKRIGQATYNGVLNLLILNGARDWMSNRPPNADDVDDHHIVPKSWGRANHLGSRIDSILNRTLLSSETNRKIIGSQHPNRYLDTWMKEEKNESLVRETLRTHLISDDAFDILLRDPFEKTDFEEFLNERQETIRESIRDMFVHDRVDLSPDLRELDGRIEAVELKLRGHIVQTTGGDEARLPPHIQVRIKERIDRVLNKQPGLDPKELDRLGGKLEYADLGDLQEVIIAKSLWPQFKSTFSTPQQVQQSFAHIGELRNAIRHSRKASDVIKKYGEAAVLWFEQALQMRTP